MCAGFGWAIPTAGTGAGLRWLIVCDDRMGVLIFLVGLLADQVAELRKSGLKTLSDRWVLFDSVGSVV